MKKINIYDGCFSRWQKAAGLGEDNTEEGAKHIEWVFGESGDITFYTDTNLVRAIDDDIAKTKVAWLIEPPSLSTTHYDFIAENANYFAYVLSHNKPFLSIFNNPAKFLYYPMGGSWIRERDWGMLPKSYIVSIIASSKREAEGHKLRHAAVKMFLEKRVRVLLYGSGYEGIDRKIDGLGDCMFSVVIESIRTRGYFSEKLIDCMSVGTIPIYWGCEDVGEYFNKKGILTFGNLDQLEDIVCNLHSSQYEELRPYARENLELCKKYRCAEDWMYKQYPFLFGESGDG